MPVSPATPERLAVELLRIYLAAETILSQKVASRIMRGITDDGWAERKLAEITAVRAETAQVVRGLEQASAREVARIIQDAYELGVDEARGELREIGEVLGVQTNPRVIRALVAETLNGLHQTHVRILRKVDDAYRRIVARASAQVVTGAHTRREAAQAALNAFADEGISGFVDAAGRSWDLSSYAEMSIRTTTGHAAIEGHLDSLTSLGQELVIVSDVPQECPICRPWEGRTLSITGNHPRYPSVDRARAQGLFHPNCRHDIGLFVEGFTRPFGRTADPIGATERAQQRYLERGVRQWKRRAAVGDPAAAAKVGEWQSRLKQHVDATDAKRLAYRESIGAR